MFKNVYADPKIKNVFNLETGLVLNHEFIRSEEIKIRSFTFCFHFWFSDYETLFDQIKIQTFGTALKDLTKQSYIFTSQNYTKGIIRIEMTAKF